MIAEITYILLDETALSKNIGFHGFLGSLAKDK